ncbi:hypothetical protein [Bdellovibrio sp. HCB337]|uniref:hypothetical protein n=1 Tax=Bdellovibrio sp. HCB337 TaxID=3394358 RepID=UPI0039A5E0CB
MPKFSFSLVLVVGLLSSLSAQADGEQRKMLAERYSFGELPFENGKFKNDPVGNYTVGTNEAKTKASYESQVGFSHRLEWVTEEIENDNVLAISEVRLKPAVDTDGKPITTVWSRTTTMIGDELRSITTCTGGSRKDKEEKVMCATATRRACDRVLAAYNSAKGMNSMSMTDSAKVSNYCQGVLLGYKNIAEAFAKESPQVGGRREDVADGDTKRLTKLINKATKDADLKATNINNSTSSADGLGKTVESFAASMDGLQTMQTAIEYCNDSKSFFRGGSASGTTGAAPAGANRATQ